MSPGRPRRTMAQPCLQDESTRSGMRVRGVSELRTPEGTRTRHGVSRRRLYSSVALRRTAKSSGQSAEAYGCPLRRSASHSSCGRELPVLRSRTDKVPFVAGDVEKHRDAAVGFGARCREELHARGCHPCARGIEVLDVEEETDPAGGLLPDDGGLVSPSARASSRPVAAPGGRTTTHRLGRPSFVRAGESSTSSKPSASTKKLTAGSYSPTTMAIRPRCTAPV